MRKVIITSFALLLAFSATASAQDIDSDIAGAENAAAVARARLDALEAEVGLLRAELHEVEVAENRLIRSILALEEHQRVLWAHLQDARRVLADRAAAAYQVGPAATLEILLSVTSPSELASAQAYTQRAFGSDTQLIHSVEQARVEAETNAKYLREQRRSLEAEARRVQSLIDGISARLTEAEAVAAEANLVVEQLHERKREIEEAARRQAMRQALLDQAAHGGPYHADWDAIAQCEASGNWAANTGNGYWGGLQFHPSTWYAYGGGAFDGKGPFPYGRSEQIVVGERVLASQGPGAWPHCFRSA
jgi:peptidoglycan hydrolase CwlO-like protein